MKLLKLIFLFALISNCTNNLQKSKTDKNMASNDISTLEKSAEMIDEEKFWKIVASSLENSNNEYEQEKQLINEIGKLSLKEMIGFRLRTDKLLFDTYNSEMWCAGYIMNGGCSDDGFEYFRNWVISQGKETYYSAKENPDNLIKEVSAERYEYEFESFWYVALEAFKIKTGKDLYDYIDYEEFKTREGNYNQFEFTWQEDNPESMKAICPQLFDKLWN